MTFSIREISSELQARGYRKASTFQVIVNPPPALVGKTIKTPAGAEFVASSVDFVRSLSFRVEAVTLPGVVLQTSEVQRYGIGPVQRQPFSGVFRDTNLRILVDSGGAVEAFFYTWLNRIFNFGDSQGLIDSTPKAASYEMGYREDYQTDLVLDEYDPLGNLAVTRILHRAYPTLVMDAPVDWGAADTLQKSVVGFTFFDWTLEGVTSS